MIKRIFLLIPLLLGSLYSIDFYQAEGEDVSFRIQDSLAYYHQFSDDQHWYGSNSWAVRYDFRNYFLGIPAEFTTSNIWIYFPNEITQGTLSYEFCLEEINQPDLTDPILSESVNITEIEYGWNVFSFNETVLDSIIWIIINYETNDDDQFISASIGDGEHSYYESEGYYYSMSAGNFNSEFLVCLEGEFFLDIVDIELGDFQLSAEPAFLEDIYPIFQVRNYHSEQVDSIFILYTVNAPFGTIRDTISMPGENSSLEAGEELILDLTGSEEYAYTILDTASQYKFTASLQCDEDSFSYNNNITWEYDIFSIEPSLQIVENFLQLDENAQQIWLDQSDLEENITIINNFPMLSDQPFYNNWAVDRFNFYSLYGLPGTVISGTEKIIGYDPAEYSLELTAELEEAFLTGRTYITGDSLYAELDDHSNIASYKIFLENDSAFLFSTYLNDLTLYVALVEDSLTHEGPIQGSVMSQIIQEKSEPELGFGSSDSIFFNLELNSLEPISDLSNMKLIYWIQHNETGRIDYINTTTYLPDIEYDQVTSGGSNDIPEPLDVTIYPNPFYSGQLQTMKFNVRQDLTSMVVKIYNIKGQLVRILRVDPAKRNSDVLSWDGRDESGIETGSGIYFMRFLPGSTTQTETVKKCLFIRN
jgi:hypothetical protein